MLRKLIVLICLIGAHHAYSQEKKTATTEQAKSPYAVVDYKQMGAPLPPIKLIPYYDSGNKIVPNTEMIIKDSMAKAGHHHKKNKGNSENLNDPHRKSITNKDVNNDANLFVMMFNPTCSHCQDETELFEKNIYYFNNSKILLVATPMMSQYLPNFNKTYHIAEFPTFTLGTDSSDIVSNIFLYRALPQINIYNSERKLIKTFSGEVGIDSLKEYIQ